MNVTVIIIIILALLVLGFLVYSFIKSGGSLTDTIKNFFGGSSNVDTIKNACNAACITSQSYEYDTVRRDVKFDKDTRVTGVTCRQLESARPEGCYSGNIKATDTTLTIENKDKCKGVWGAAGQEGAENKCTVNTELEVGLITEAQCNAVAWQPAYPKVLDNPCTNIIAPTA